MIEPILLYRSDVTALTGWGINKARKFITEIWAQKELPRQRWISLSDFCQECRMPEETVLKLLQAVQQAPRKQS
ncbi:hypothetical protein [Paraflavitalea sp. CAU 1676]|uniref:hypothetical protein n=1 Tax=Paraflavitalea sp. CAU 1676 TaxID=3032598 RepID=UPI0023DB2531|nr:hypothetical protein [Paraflavitalea sp. CAU 1676]MDF2189144.1 hypothetical protein [Paraflavitalea sp. CAU 1676]